MDAEKILDDIFAVFQKLPKNAKISETMKANKDAMKIIKDALFNEYKRGCDETAERIKKQRVENQIKNN